MRWRKLKTVHQLSHHQYKIMVRAMDRNKLAFLLTEWAIALNLCTLLIKIMFKKLKNIDIIPNKEVLRKCIKDSINAVKDREIGMKGTVSLTYLSITHISPDV